METLKQPELGNTIADLRQKKQLTQEELVEKCNLNVRTLQRIEAGDVTPRGYTIRAIFEALEYDLDRIENKLTRKASLKWLQIAWISGIVYFVLGIVETAVDTMRFEDYSSLFPLAYMSVKALSIASFTAFMIGFVEVGKQFSSFLLKISAFLMLASWCLIELYDIITIYSDLSFKEFLNIKSIEAVAFGGIDVVFGVALFRLGKKIGTSATVAGILEIIVGICLVTMVLAIVGWILLIPATIIEIIVIYKCYDMIQSKS